MQLAEAFVSIRPSVDPARFQAETTRAIQGPVGRATDTASRSAKVRPSVDAGSFQQQLKTGVVGPARQAASGLTRLFAVFAVGRLITGAIDAQRQAGKAARETSAILTATGHAAHVSEGDIASLTKALQEYAAVHDDVIRSGANVLLTFKNIRNELGEGNDIFNQATKTALDMASVFEGDLQGSIVQLGKALEDPAKGLTALTRIGITFDAQQTKMIKGLTEQGRLLEAQQILLAAVTGQVGGAAGEAADDVQRASLRIKNAQEQLGAAILPIAGRIGGALAGMAEAFAGLPAPITTTVIAASGLALISPYIVSAASAARSLAQWIFGLAGPTKAAAVAQAALGASAGTAAVGLTAEATAANAAAVATNRVAIVAARLGTVLAGGAAVGGLLLLGRALNENRKRAKEWVDQYLKDRAADTIPERIKAITSALEEANRAKDNATGLTFPIVGGGVGTEDWKRAANQVDELEKELEALKAQSAANDRQTRLTKRGVDEWGNAYGAATGAVESHTDALKRQQTAADRLGRIFDRRVARLQTQIDVEGAVASVGDARRALDEARADVAGTGERARAAADAEADAYLGLADAQKSATDAAKTLQAAQRELADFSSGRNARIRQLKEESIQARVVQTPEDVRQKELDLLELAESTADEKARLQEGVAAGERAVQDAAGRTAEAQRAVTDAIEERKKVAVEAARDQESAERDYTEAILAAARASQEHAEALSRKNPYGKAREGLVEYLDTLRAFAVFVEPGSELARDLAALIAQFSDLDRGPSAGFGNVPLGPPLLPVGAPGDLRKGPPSPTTRGAVPGAAPIHFEQKNTYHVGKEQTADEIAAQTMYRAAWALAGRR